MIVTNIHHLLGSKKRIKWLFGFTNSDQEHEVVLIHSLVSGKKTILENGVEIVTVSNILAQDFSHGWQSQAGRRIYRVEANIGVASEHFYTFSVDGIRFLEMPYKASNNSRRLSAVNKSSAVPSNNNNYASPPQRRASTGTITNNSAERRNLGSNDAPNNSSSFDPFESNESIDPFASSPSSNNNNNSNSKAIARTKSASPPVAVAVQIKPSASASLFDNFDDDEPAPQTAEVTADFDPFVSSSTPIVDQSSFDPFATSPSSNSFTNNNNNNSNNSNNNYTSNAVKIAAPTSKQVSVARHRPSISHSSTTDFLSTSSEDLFVSQNNEQDLFGGAGPSVSKKSAADISKDFAGLTFDVPSPVVPTFPVATSKVVETPKEEVFVQEEAPASKDPWDVKNLVDLDLTGKNKQVARKQTSVAGPSLDSLMGGASFQSCTAVRQQPAAFSNPSLPPSDPLFALINKGTDPFGNTSLITPSTLTPSVSSATNPPVMMMSGFGQPAPYQQQAPTPPVYGMGLGSQPPPQFGGLGPPPPGPGGMIGHPSFANAQTGPTGWLPNKPVYGSGLMANKPVVGSNNNFAMSGSNNTGPYGYGNTNPVSKNSLDTLNWKG